MVPVLLAFGKKTQICGFMSTDRIDQVERNVFRVSSRLNSTWGGNLVDMVRGARYLQVMVEDRLVENAARQGARLLDGLRDLAERLAVVTNPRGRGCLLAFDLPDTEIRNAVRTDLWQAGLATLACGSRSIRLRPPLIIREAEVDLALERLEQVLAARHARA